MYVPKQASTVINNTISASAIAKGRISFTCVATLTKSY